MNQFKGFIVSSIVVIICFIIAAFSAGYIAGFLGIWKKPIIGAVAAFCVVICGYITAPNYKRTSAASWLIVGAISAWFLAGDSFYPEDHEHAYQHTIIPIAATYVSGLIALVGCFLWHKKQSK